MTDITIHIAAVIAQPDGAAPAVADAHSGTTLQKLVGELLRENEDLHVLISTES